MKPTREQIEKAKSYELDKMVNDHIFNRHLKYAPDYSDDIRCAWSLVEKLADKYTFRLTDISVGNKVWQASFKFRDGVLRFPTDIPHEGDAHADHAIPAVAICRAALLAVLVL